MVFAVVFLVGCGGASPTAPPPIPTPTPSPASDALSVASIAPAGGTLLQPGQAVTFTATLNCTLASTATGTVAIVIQDQLDRSLQAPGRPQPETALSRGSSSVTLTDSIVIPASGVSSVRVFFPLIPSGATTTSVVRLVTYPVG